MVAPKSAIIVLFLALVFTLHALAASSAANDQGKDDPPKRQVRLIKDEAKILSKEAIEETNAIIKKIFDERKKEFFIEIVAQGPEIDKSAAWAKERFDSFKIDGIYLVITRKPGNFQILVDPVTLTTFTKDDITALEKILTAKQAAAMRLKNAATYTLDALKRAKAK